MIKITDVYGNYFFLNPQYVGCIKLCINEDAKKHGAMTTIVCLCGFGFLDDIYVASTPAEMAVVIEEALCQR